MTLTRVFLLASGLARLIERERAGDLVRQGSHGDDEVKIFRVRMS